MLIQNIAVSLLVSSRIIEFMRPQIAVCSFLELYLKLSSMYLSSNIIWAHSSGCQIRLRLMPDLQHTPIQSHRDGALGSHLQQLRRSTLQGPVLPEYSPLRTHHEHTTMAANRERSTWKWREDASDKSAGCHG